MYMLKVNHLEFIDNQSKLCASDAQARYLAWKIKKSKKRYIQFDRLILAKGKGLNDQLDS